MVRVSGGIYSHLVFNVFAKTVILKGELVQTGAVTQTLAWHPCPPASVPAVGVCAGVTAPSAQPGGCWVQGQRCLPTWASPGPAPWES